MILVVAYSSHKLIAEEAKKNATNILRSTKFEVEKIFEEVEVSTQNIQWIIEDNIDDEQYIEHLTKKIVETNPHIAGSAIAFEIGAYKNRHHYAPFSYKPYDKDTIITQYFNPNEYDYLTMDWYQIPKLLKKPSWCEPYYDEGASNHLTATFSRPLINKEGKVYAIFTADLDMTWLVDKIKSIHPYSDSGSHTFLLGKSGVYISYKDMERVNNETIFSIATVINDSICMQIGKDMVDGKSGLAQFESNEGPSFAVYGPLSNGWSVAIICSYRAVLEPTLHMNIILISVGAFGLFLLFILCLITIRKLTKPITQFSESALSIATGNFETKLPIIKTNDELATLRDSFDFMQQSINVYIKELKITTAANERLESELNIARDIQMQMIPKNFPVNANFDLSAVIIPAKEVGGDLYDFFVRDNRLYFAVGDVSGKGIPASLFMAVTRSTFHFIAGLDVPMDILIEKLNDSLCEGNDSMMFVTMFAGVIDLDTKEFCYCNAGHNPIIIKPKNEEANYLKAESNLALGLMDGFKYKMEQMQLEEGTRLFIYTDGVTEAENVNKELYGEERFLKWSQTLTNETAEQSIEKLRIDVKAFTQANPQNDDITILSIII